MDIRIKEPLYILAEGKEHIVRAGTVGVERNRVVFFYDNMRVSAIGFSRDYCLENPQLFQVARTLSDKEVSMRDVLKVIDEVGLPQQKANEICERIKSL